jgi:UDP-N-acetylmuramate dehydrogenase
VKGYADAAAQRASELGIVENTISGWANARERKTKRSAKGPERIMEPRHRKMLREIAGSNVRFDCPMRLYTTYRVGGKAAAFFRARDMEGLLRMLALLEAQSVPWLVLGKGSNVLIGDRGYDGVVIRLRGTLAALEGSRRNGVLAAGGGAANRRLLDVCADKGFGGLEFLAGIPGTAGGAVAMNAGSFGRETGEVVERVELAIPGKEPVHVLPKDLEFGYRRCSLPHGAVVTRVWFAVRLIDSAAVSRRIAGNLERRRKSQPRGFPSAGSVFRNPPGDSAGRLVEKAGLKGERLGGAVISSEHANWIVNTGGATAADIHGLMTKAREEVLRRTGIALEPEVRVIGF